MVVRDFGARMGAQTPQQRKAEWTAQRVRWHESVGAKRIGYWAKRSDMKSEYEWRLDPIDVRNAIVMLCNLAAALSYPESA